MKTQNFQNLIQKVTGRPLIINTNDVEIVNGKDYIVYRPLPLTDSSSSFKWTAPLSDEKMLRSFITAFCTKYREPNPAAYDYHARTYGEKAKWEYKTEKEKEYAYRHHVSNMYCKKYLMEQIEANFNSEDMQTALINYGFYPTEYGVGIFALWETQAVVNAINTMAKYLNNLSIPYKNEYSDARWVLRFKIGLNKDTHIALLTNFK